MHITNVELIHREEVPEGTMKDGLPVPAQPETYHFSITTDENDVEGAEITVPADPKNRHYREVAEWYKKQKKKPFKFDFADLD